MVLTACLRVPSLISCNLFRNRPPQFSRILEPLGSLSLWERAGVRGVARRSTSGEARSERHWSGHHPHPNPLPEGEGARKRRNARIGCSTFILWIAQDHHCHGKRPADPRGHHRPRFRGRVHPDLPGVPRRRGLRDLPAVEEGPRRVRRPLEDRQAVHRVRAGPRRPRDRRGPHQLADPGPRLAVDRRARGGQARRLHRADGHDRRGMRPDRRGPAQGRARST